MRKAKKKDKIRWPKRPKRFFSQSEQNTRDLIRAVVKALNAGDRNLWNVLSALRGPDSEHSELKNLTTSRVRAFVGMLPYDASNHWYRSFANVNLKPLTADQCIRRDKLLEDQGHFGAHYSVAVSSILALYDYGLRTESFPLPGSKRGFQIPNRKTVNPVGKNPNVVSFK